MKLKFSSISKYLLFIIAVAVLWITILILFRESITINQGIFTYVLDDPYIHMAMAKNLILHGVWGVDKYGFTSSSSSPLWIIVLSLAYFLFGVNLFIPFILNIIFATIFIFIAYSIFRYYKLQPAYNLIFLLFLIFFTPIPALAFTGMEHVLQILLIVSFAFIGVQMLCEYKANNLKYIMLLILAALVVAVRYEDLIMVLIIAAIFFIKREFWKSLSILGASMVPVFAYGIYSTMNGWFFLPNSLITKTIFVESKTQAFSLNGIFLLVNNFLNIQNLFIFIPLILAVGLLVFRFREKKILWNSPNILLTLFIGTATLHMIAARTGWFYRYEAYLIALGILTIAIGISEYLPAVPKWDKKLISKNLTLIIIIFVLFVSLAGRGYCSFNEVPKATHNIYDQQYQMGLFIQKYYKGDAVSLNDVGAVNYVTDIKSVDLLGLSGLNVSKEILKENYTIKNIDNITRQNHVKVIIVYEDLYRKYLTGGIPSDWIKVGQWKITNRITCFMDTVSFYAIDPKDAENLTKNLKEFSSQLPPDVQQSGNYMDKD
ncbi:MULTISPECIES: hypothetical protein [Methanobacterium]|uniref:hypothetical protein n=1 Tax=Methanobacterium TaxID=2160 RepID=UPI000B235CB1|nr:MULTISPECIES: hypothetical protein [Methanobacterium]